MITQWLQTIFSRFKKKQPTKSKEQINQALLAQLVQFREETKSLDYLRKELEEANKGKSDEEIMNSLAKTLASDQRKRA